MPIIDVVEFFITDFCNMKCAGCNHFIPLVEKPYYQQPEKIIADLKRIVEITGEDIPEIFVSGGEPLLHPNFLEILEEIHRIQPNAKINIKTNGTLLPKQSKEFYKFIDNDFVRITTSLYASLNPMLRKLILRAESDNRVIKDREYFSYNAMSELRIIDNYKNIDFHYMCPRPVVNDRTFCCSDGSGLLHHCFMTVFVHHYMKKFNKKFDILEGSDYLDMSKNISKEDVYNLVRNDKKWMHNFCEYCRLPKHELWVPFEKNKDYWIFE